MTNIYRVLSIGMLVGLAACSDASNDLTGPLDESADARKPRGGTPTTPTAPSSGVLAGKALYVESGTRAALQAAEWRTSRPSDALQMDKIAAQSQARWFGNWNGDVATAVSNFVGAALNAGKMPVMVAYNIPQRDCGGLSGGNATAPDQYRSWIKAFADGIKGRPATVILEPDAVAAMDCLNGNDQQLRLTLLKEAVTAIKGAGGLVYIDAGHPRWQTATLMASRLQGAGIAMADGFSLNVSNFIATGENINYGTNISNMLQGKRFVIDTGRNGLGPTADGQWCNPAGRALGDRPNTSTGNTYVDAFLWIKTPGESDGACNGAPVSGTWMPEYALGLAQRAAY